MDRSYFHQRPAFQNAPSTYSSPDTSHDTTSIESTSRPGSFETSPPKGILKTGTFNGHDVSPTASDKPEPSVYLEIHQWASKIVADRKDERETLAVYTKILSQDQSQKGKSLFIELENLHSILRSESRSARAYIVELANILQHCNRANSDDDETIRLLRNSWVNAQSKPWVNQHPDYKVLRKKFMEYSENNSEGSASESPTSESPTSEISISESTASESTTSESPASESPLTPNESLNPFLIAAKKAEDISARVSAKIKNYETNPTPPSNSTAPIEVINATAQKKPAPLSSIPRSKTYHDNLNLAGEIPDPVYPLRRIKKFDADLDLAKGDPAKPIVSAAPANNEATPSYDPDAGALYPSTTDFGYINERGNPVDMHGREHDR